MTKYAHSETTLGDIVVTDDGMSVECSAGVATMGVIFVVKQIDFQVDILRSADEKDDFRRLFDMAYAQGKRLASAYIAARVERAA